MAWVKIPKEHHPIFMDALPMAPDVDVVKMFGGLAAMVSGNMAGGLFARSVVVRLDDAGVQEVLALEGSGPFDPMGNGRSMAGAVMLPESVMDEADELRGWLMRAIAFARSLPPKVKKKSKAKAKPGQAKPAAKAKAKAKPAAKARAKAKPAARPKARPATRRRPAR